MLRSEPRPRHVFRSVVISVGASTLALLSMFVGCSSDPAPTVKPERLCTPGNYVFCRCADRSEGTKLCSQDGFSFAECDCGKLGGDFPDLSPDGDASFEPLDSGKPDGGPAISDRCSGKLAVLASRVVPIGTPEDIYLYASVYSGGGTWLPSRSPGPALRSTPRGGLVGSTLVAVWQSRFSLVAWTKFEAQQTTLAPPVSVGSALTDKPPAFLGGADKGTLFYLTRSDAFRSGTYTAAAGWDDSVTPISPGVPDIAGKTAPAVTSAGSGVALAFAGSNQVAVQIGAGSTWDAAAPISGATPLAAEPPAIAPLAGADDLMVVYQGVDQLLRSATRSRATLAWSAPVLVDTTASSNGPPSVVALKEGRALIVWRGANNAPYYSLYAPGRSKPWSNPAAVVGSLPALAAPPALAYGNCASEATMTYVDLNGNVALSFFAADGWSAPFVVPDFPPMTFAGAGEVP